MFPFLPIFGWFWVAFALLSPPAFADLNQDGLNGNPGLKLFRKRERHRSKNSSDGLLGLSQVVGKNRDRLETNNRKTANPPRIFMGPLPEWNAENWPTDAMMGLGGSLWPQEPDLDVTISTNPSVPVPIAIAYSSSSSLSPILLEDHPGKYLIDPNQIITPKTASELRRLLEIHARRCSYDVCLMLPDDGQKTIIGRTSDAITCDQRTQIVIVYRKGQRPDVHIDWDNTEANKLNPAIVDAMLVSGTQKSLASTNRDEQVMLFARELTRDLRRFANPLPDLSTIDYDMAPPANLLPVSGNIATLPLEASPSRGKISAPGILAFTSTAAGMFLGCLGFLVLGLRKEIASGATSLADLTEPLSNVIEDALDWTSTAFCMGRLVLASFHSGE